MRIEQLHYVLEIANKGSIGIAADSLFMAQQSLSQSIKNLEQELGVTLFIRTKNGVCITPAGKTFCKFAEETLANLAEIKYEFSQMTLDQHATEKTTLTIDMNKIFDYAIVPNALKAFRRENTSTIITSNSKDITTIYDNLKNLPFEQAKDYIAFVNLPCVEQTIMGDLYLNSDYKFTPIYDGSFKLCVNKSSHLSKNKTISLKEIAKHPIIFLSSGTEFTSNTGLFFQYYGLDNIDAALSTSSLNIWLNCIEENIGIGFLHSIMFEKSIMPTVIDKASNNLSVLSIKEPLFGILGYITHKNCSEIVRSFLEYIPKYVVHQHEIKFNK